MTKLLDLLEEYFEVKKYQYCRIDGTISQPARQAEVHTMQNFMEPYLREYPDW